MWDLLNLCQNQKKNTVDPETMINQYGADAVRWFILSDSPPEKDVQWSDVGVVSANKFLQKIWNLNFSISKRKEDLSDKNLDEKFSKKIDVYVSKIDYSIKKFRFNVSIALFYEMFSLIRDHLNLKISNVTFKKNLIKFMKLMIPFTPHLAHECLDSLNCKTINLWPQIDDADSLDDIKFAIQVNGKTRDIIEIKKDIDENEINGIVRNDSKAKKYLENVKIIRIIFVKNKIINYITKN